MTLLEVRLEVRLEVTAPFRIPLLPSEFNTNITTKSESLIVTTLILSPNASLALAYKITVKS